MDPTKAPREQGACDIASAAHKGVIAKQIPMEIVYEVIKQILFSICYNVLKYIIFKYFKQLVIKMVEKLQPS